MTKVEFNLPDKLVCELDRAGLLAPEALEKLLRAELRELAFQRLGKMLDEAERDPLTPMTTEEIQAEIDACRAEKRRAAAS